jgi:hypothetical protein
LKFSKKIFKKPKNAPPGGQGGSPNFQIFKKKLKKPENHPPGGQGFGGSNFMFLPDFYLYKLGAHAKI